jgi:hypothetical protein
MIFLMKTASWVMRIAAAWYAQIRAMVVRAEEQYA